MTKHRRRRRKKRSTTEALWITGFGMLLVTSLGIWWIVSVAYDDIGQTALVPAATTVIGVPAATNRIGTDPTTGNPTTGQKNN